ncbi:MAG: response regulator [Spirochaetes bacterium]|nr:response regulator [Spirochaetota bacterium]
MHETRPFSKDGKTPLIAGKPDIIKFPLHYLRKGMNILAIRTGALDFSGGFDGKLLLGANEKIKSVWMRNILWNFCIGSIFIFLSFYFLLYYWRRKNEKYYLFFSAMSFFGGLWSIAFKGYIQWIFDYQWIYILFVHNGEFLFSYMFVNFVNSFLNYKKTIITKIFLLFYIILSITVTIEFFITGSIFYFIKYLYDLFLFSCIPVNLYLIFLCIKGIKQKISFSNRLLLGIILYSIATVLTIIMYTFATTESIFNIINITKFDQPAMEGFFAMIIVFATILASRFSQIHNDLEKAHEELLKVDKMKDEFMAVTSHELRTPLLGIEGLADSMLDGAAGKLSPEARRNIEMIALSGKRLSTLVNDILDLSRIKYSKLNLNKKNIDFKHLAGVAVKFSESAFKYKNIRIINNIPDDSPGIFADPNRFLQIMHNLIENAIKYTNKGQILIYSRVLKNFVEITVQDTGLGISPERFEDIFKSFEQLDSSITRMYQGTGLGLSITKQLIELHGGEIHVESTPGIGSKFIFTMPVYSDQDKSDKTNPESNTDSSYTDEIVKLSSFSILGTGLTQPHNEKKTDSSADTSHRNGKYILVVDDEPVIQNVLKNILTLNGYRVDTAGDGNAAMEKLETGELPDLVILDIMLPGISGFDICRKIRENHPLYDLPILMCTAKTEITDMVTGMESGANDYLAKPFDKRELIARVSTLILLKDTIDEYKVTRLSNLQKRLSPHFLFNAIHAIHSLIHTNPEKADAGILRLAEIYRYLVDRSLEQTVDFSEEWNFVKSYLEFEKIRFPEILSYKLILNGDFKRIKIPPLILQPLVENAIKHGIRRKTNPGLIEVYAEMDENEIILTVIDDGPGPDSGNHFSRSLGNIRERLKLHFRESEITLQKYKKNGAIAIVKFSADSK